MPDNANGWRITTVLAGAITAGTQIVLLREVLSAFLGNELVFGILLFDWLALTGLGAVLARRWTPRLRPSVVPSIVLGALLLLPPLTFLGFRILPLVVAPPGSMLEIWIFLVGAILVLSPVCLISGAVFSMLVGASVSGGTANPAGNVYALEAAGSLGGGVLFGIFLFDLIVSQDLLVLLCAGAGTAGAVLAYQSGVRRAAALLTVGVLLLVYARISFDVDTLTFALRYPGQ